MRAVLCLACLVRVANAEPDVFLEVVPPVDGNAPGVRATVIEGPREQCTLAGISPVEWRGLQTSEPITIVLLVNNQEVMGAWRGEDDEFMLEDEQHAPIDDFKAAFDKFDFTRLGEGDFVVIGYSTGAEVMRPSAPLAQLKGPAFGARSQYMRHIGTDLVQGVTRSLDELEASRATRKVLIVIGDGNDTNNDAAAHQLAELARRARRLHVESFAFVYKTAVSSEGAAIENFTTPVVMNSQQGIESELAHVMRRLSDRQTFVYPGDALPWDGQTHPLAVACGTHALGMFDLAMLPVWTPPAKPRSKLPLVVIVLAAAAIAGAAIALARRRR